MRKTTAGIAFLLAFFVATRVTSGAGVPLAVDWDGVAMDRPFPVTGGVPFARGALKDATAVRLLHRNREVPLQTEVLAWWPDTSVKWLLLDFQAPPGQKQFTLEYGPDVKRTPPANRIVALSRNGTVRIDTGAVTFVVKGDGSGFIDELLFEGKQVFSSAGKRLNVLDFIHTKSPADYNPMNRYLRNGEADPSRAVIDDVTLEKRGPLRAVVRIDGKFTYRKVGSTITGTTVKSDCPFRIRIHAYAGQSFLRVEHFFYYEGDGDHDFAQRLTLKVGVPAGTGRIRFIGRETLGAAGPMSGLYQMNADEFVVWNSTGASIAASQTGRRFEGVLDVTAGGVGVAVGIKDFWRNAPKSLHANLKTGEVALNLYAPEACPLDFRRHAREWSVGETGTPNEPRGTKPRPFRRDRYRLASKGVGKTHYALIHAHRPDAPADSIRAIYRLFNRRPLVWALPRYYARTLALGRYRERVKGRHDEVEEVLASGIEVWRSARERFRWYGFWLYGNVCQDYNGYFQNGRWSREFGRWGWANGDSVGRLAYALMLQSVRTCARADFEFGESYLYHVHDVCSTHTPAYPHHYGEFRHLKGASHRHGAWPWSGPYVGARGAHPVGAKIYYYLTGEGHAKDILEEMVQLALRNPNGGEGDGPLGPNAQSFLYKWEATGDDQWRVRLKAELEKSELLRTANSGWLCMMSAAFGIKDALDEYMDLSGDYAMKGLSADFADRCMPAKMKRHWTWGGYFRVYASAYNATRDAKYKAAIEEMLQVLVGKGRGSLAFKVPRSAWPGPPGGPRPFVDANIIRDVPFALYSLHLKEGE